MTDKKKQVQMEVLIDGVTKFIGTFDNVMIDNRSENCMTDYISSECSQGSEINTKVVTITATTEG